MSINLNSSSFRLDRGLIYLFKNTKIEFTLFLFKKTKINMRYVGHSIFFLNFLIIDENKLLFSYFLIKIKDCHSK